MESQGPQKDRRRGQSLVEYALILTLVALVIVMALTSLGGESSNSIETARKGLDPDSPNGNAYGYYKD